VRKLGAGSAGQVYEAYFMGAPVAVKILNTVDASGERWPGNHRFRVSVTAQTVSAFSGTFGHANGFA
jgi:hypothetical protein